MTLTPKHLQITAPMYRRKCIESDAPQINLAADNPSVWLPYALGYHQVLPGCSRSEHSAVYKLGRYFTREMGFDFVMFEPSGTAICPDRSTYLINTAEIACGSRLALGVVAIINRRTKDETYPELQWVWLHPYYRRCGVLSTMWPALTKSHPGLRPCPPVSKALLGFMKQVGHPHD